MLPSYSRHCVSLQVVRITWVDEDKAVNIGIRSVIDGKAMDGITSFRIHSGPDMTQDR